VLISVLGQLLSFVGTDFCLLSPSFPSPCDCLLQASLLGSLPLSLPRLGMQQHLGAVTAPKAGSERSVLRPQGGTHSQDRLVPSPGSQQ